MRQFVFPGIALLGSAVLLGCSNSSVFDPVDPGPTDPTPRFTTKEQQTLQTFASCADFKTYVSDALTLEYTTGYWAGVPCWSCDTAIEPIGTPTRVPPPQAFAEDGDLTASPSPPAPAAPEMAGDEAGRVNDTNTQESGVDEADRVEARSDGNLMFFLANEGGQPSEVVVIDTSEPDSTRVIARIALDAERFFSGLYYDEPNERLVVVSAGGYFFPLSGGDLAIAPGLPPIIGSVIQAFDVSDPANPQSLGRFETDAQIISSRRIDDRLHVVSQFGIPLPANLSNDSTFFDLVYDDYFRALQSGNEDDIARLRAEIASRIRTAVDATDVAALLPRNSHGDAAGDMLACDNVYAPDVEQRLGLIQVSSMDTDLAASTHAGLINNGWNVYASVNNLYITQSSSGWWFDQAQAQQTAIHRMELSADAAPIYRGSGVVDGWAHNPFQFSEHDGHLRVATTLQGPAFLPPDQPVRLTNKASVLALADDGLNLTGETPTFGPEEDIRSARFLGERGFVVTFRQIDPLFALDLADPTAPQVVGEIEIPGFSSYIHPLGPDQLLTIGPAGNADNTGIDNTFQLQIFSIDGAFDDDPNTGITQDAVERIDITVDEYAFSLAQSDPLAFNFLASANDPAVGTLSIPVQIGSPQPERAFSGFFTYTIDGPAAAISRLLQMDHAQRIEGQGSSCPEDRTPPPDGANAPTCSGFAPVIWNEPLRTKIVERGLLPGVDQQRFFFSFSSRLLRVDTPDPLPPPPLGDGDTTVTQLPLRDAS